jgi:hypothetical protein
MRSIPMLVLMTFVSVLPAAAQDATPPPKVISSDACIFGAPADAHQVAAAKTVTIVKCKLTAPLIPDASVNAALGQNAATKGVAKDLGAGNILATTASGSNVTIYVNGDD